MKRNAALVKTLMCLFLFVCFRPGIGQNVAINSTGSAPNSSAMLDVSSSSKGLLIPRVSLSSLTDASTLPSPANSLLIYNTNTAITGGAGYYYNDGTSGSPAWVKLVTINAAGIVKSTTPTGDIIALDRPPMGEVSMTGNASGTTIAVQNTYYKVAGTTSFSSESYNFSNGGTSNRLTYTGASQKMFHIACTLSISAAQSNQVIKAVLYKNGSPLSAGIVQTKLGGTGDVTSTAIHVMTSLSQNDYLELYITNTSGTYALTITDMNMFAMGVSMGLD